LQDEARANQAEADPLHRLTPKVARALSLYRRIIVPLTEAFEGEAPFVKDERA
jgi:hypothetical protein